MWAKQNFWLSLQATSLRPLTYTVKPPSMYKVIFIVMDMMLLYLVGGVISQSSLSLRAKLYCRNKPKILTWPQMTLNSQFPGGPSGGAVLCSQILPQTMRPVLGISFLVSPG